MSDQFSTVSDSEAVKHRQTRAEEKVSPLVTTAILYGAIAGVLMSLFLSVSGFYIVGDNAGFGFLKFLILGAALYPLLIKTKKATPTGASVKNGLMTGTIAGATAGVVSAIAVFIFNGKIALSGEVDGAGDVAINQFALAGISFFECLVAGLIISLIILQFIKEGKPAK